MGISINYSDNFSNFSGESLAKRVEAKVRKQLKQQEPNIWEEFFKKMSIDIKEMFDDVIDEFYTDYHPRNYERTGIIKNLLEVVPSTDHIAARLDSDNMSGHRTWGTSRREGRQLTSGEEEALYVLDFKMGWHGGHQRTIGGSRYSLGGPVAIMTPPPLELMKERAKEYSKTKGRDLLSNILQSKISNIKL